MAAPYPDMNGTLIGSDLGQIFVYVDSITGGYFAPFLILSFFLLVFLSSLLWSLRISGKIKIELHVAAASFSTMGFTLILTTIKGFVSPIYILIVAAITILSGVWILLSNPNENY